MEPVFLAFPPGAVVCAPGDYLICRDVVKRWQVYRLEDLLLVKRLVPLPDDPSTLMLEEHARDSMAPAYAEETHLLMTAFEPGFADEPQALQAIDQQALSERATGLLRPAREFPAHDCRVVRQTRTR
jgi:hypothetical protein